MPKERKPYKKPELKEVKLQLEEQILASCRASRTSTVNYRTSRRTCANCRNTYSAS